MVYAILSRILFCPDLRTFVWRKIAPKIVSVEKKGQISCMYVYAYDTYVLVRIEHSVTKKHNVSLGPAQALKVFCVFCPQRFSCFAG